MLEPDRYNRPSGAHRPVWVVEPPEVAQAECRFQGYRIPVELRPPRRSLVGRRPAGRSCDECGSRLNFPRAARNVCRRLRYFWRRILLRPGGYGFADIDSTASPNNGSISIDPSNRCRNASRPSTLTKPSVAIISESPITLLRPTAD